MFTKGVLSKTPFLITLSAPDCEQTNIRPSGAIAIAVGEAIPLATVVSKKPNGSVAAEAEKDKPNDKDTIAMNNRPWNAPLICGRPGWLGKPFISLTHQDDGELHRLVAPNLSASHCNVPPDK
jgi:hypothetical protein